MQIILWNGKAYFISLESNIYWLEGLEILAMYITSLLGKCFALWLKGYFNRRIVISVKLHQESIWPWVVIKPNEKKQR